VNVSIPPQALPGAVCAGVAVTSLVLAAARPRKRLGPRLDDYTLVARSKLGSAPDVLSLTRPATPAMSGALARVFRPMLASVAHGVGALAGTRDEEALALQLRQAGVAGVTPKRYRDQQLLLACLGAGAGLFTGVVAGFAVGRPAALGLVLGASGFVLGTVWKSAELARHIRERRETLRAELFSLCQVLAVYARATPNLLHITEQVAARSSGLLATEMAEILRWVESGTQPEDAFAQAARFTPEPAAARLYRVMATAAASGGDIADALVAQSADIRDAQREEVKQSAVRRRGAMLAPLILLLAPIILLFVAAPIPRIVLGL